jgi:hypothetical protein
MDGDWKYGCRQKLPRHSAGISLMYLCKRWVCVGMVNQENLSWGEEEKENPLKKNITLL